MRRTKRRQLPGLSFSAPQIWRPRVILATASPLQSVSHAAARSSGARGAELQAAKSVGILNERASARAAQMRRIEDRELQLQVRDIGVWRLPCLIGRSLWDQPNPVALPSLPLSPSHPPLLLVFRLFENKLTSNFVLWPSCGPRT